MLAMHQTLGTEYCEVILEAGADHRLLRQIEQKHMGTDHAEVGGARDAKVHRHGAR